jgi:glycosyltransferase involved in cell wall biosynthesis
MPTSLRIALDATYSIGADLTGVGVYSAEIVNGLTGAHPEHSFTLCYRPHRLLAALKTPVPANCRRRPLWETHAVRADLFHGLNQRLPDAHYRRTVATFHDLFVLTAEYSTKEFRERFARQARRAAERADLIIAVSHFTAAQVRDLMGVEESRIRVIPHGVRPAVAENARPREKIVLNVGAIQKRKNIARLIRAFERTPPGWRLVLAGSAGFGAEEVLRGIGTSPRHQDIEVRGYVPAQELEDLYSRASLFAFPSLDEGFGMPVLEAMARAVPVITSNRSALPEIAGDAALQVDPLDDEAIAAALNRLIDGPELCREMTERGLARAACFTWERAVHDTWQVYRDLCNE